MKKLFVFLFILALFLAKPLFACTEFRLQAKDNTIMITRTMEYGPKLNSNIRSSNRDREFVLTTPNGKPAMSWKAKYGYVFMDGFDLDVAVDGVNERGLSFGALYLSGLTSYQVVPKNYNRKSLSYVHIGDWILSNFSTVAEVKAALQKIYVYGEPIPVLDHLIIPLHFSVYDNLGNGLVIEYINGQLNLHENKIGVLTNSPSYSWHLENLKNYSHLSPFNPEPFQLNGVMLFPDGFGFGMIGLPGDHTPPSRFVKTATILRFITVPMDADQTLNIASHIINNMDIPKGIIREKNTPDHLMGVTQWTVHKDLSHNILYFHTYEDLRLYSIDIKKLDFSKNASRLKMDLPTVQVIEDLTKRFVNSK